eukprot:TRINITY_DN66359_c0_g1_i1.p1 TRINITY_DN66359_c0_g1~~TRINITY_DN66359_c0_g1_i1.p1  ORF type:complete len:195 (-),score=23.05 TRINITY_DN66359_c0_g1_i1:179-763(-)
MEPEPAALTVCLLDGTAVEVATTSGCPAAQLRKELAAKLEQGVLLVSGDCELRDADALPDAMITAICLPHAVSVWNDWAIAVATDHVRHGRGQFCWGSFDRTHILAFNKPFRTERKRVPEPRRGFVYTETDYLRGLRELPDMPEEVVQRLDAVEELLKSSGAEWRVLPGMGKFQGWLILDGWAMEMVLYSPDPL